MQSYAVITDWKTRASDDFGNILAINGPFPEECHRSIDERRSLDLSCNSDNFLYFEFTDASVQRLKLFNQSQLKY